MFRLDIMSICVYLIVKVVLKLFFRETRVNQERGGRMGAQESQENPVFLGKRSEWCIGFQYCCRLSDLPIYR